MRQLFGTALLLAAFWIGSIPRSLLGAQFDARPDLARPSFWTAMDIALVEVKGVAHSGEATFKIVEQFSGEPMQTPAPIAASAMLFKEAWFDRRPETPELQSYQQTIKALNNDAPKLKAGQRLLLFRPRDGDGGDSCILLSGPTQSAPVKACRTIEQIQNEKDASRKLEIAIGAGDRTAEQFVLNTLINEPPRTLDEKSMKHLYGLRDNASAPLADRLLASQALFELMKGKRAMLEEWQWAADQLAHGPSLGYQDALLLGYDLCLHEELRAKTANFLLGVLNDQSQPDAVRRACILILKQQLFADGNGGADKLSDAIIQAFASRLHDKSTEIRASVALGLADCIESESYNQPLSTDERAGAARLLEKLRGAEASEQDHSVRADLFESISTIGSVVGKPPQKNGR